MDRAATPATGTLGAMRNVVAVPVTVVGTR
jgi:hypothetical protein